MENANSRRLAGKSAIAALIALAAAGAASATKPAPATYSEVLITFAGQTFGFSGPEESFSQSADGGRIVFELTQLQSPGYMPLPPVDTDTLEAHGNQWVILPKAGKRSYAFAGICASETYTTSESGVIVRHLNLNCSEFDAGAAP